MFRLERIVFRMERTASLGLAGEIARRLDAAGISQRDTAARTGIPLTTLHRRLTGTSSFTVAEVEALALLLDTKISELVSAAESAA